jgi:tripartite-type tricarboxylate transporter receptor subunit TctC
MKARWKSVFGLAVLLGFAAAAGHAGEAPFYQGKTVTIVEGRAAGGTGTLRTQAVTKYLQKYLPGNPAVVYQHIAGGGGTAAANHLVNVAKRDGLTIGNIGTGVYSAAIFGAKGVRYKLDDFVFLGSASSGGPYMLLGRPGLGTDTAEKLRAQKGLRFANRSVGHTMYILDRVMAWTLELEEPRWILGYNDAEIDPALQRGEADIRSTNLNSFLRDIPNAIKEGYTVPIIMRNTKGRGAEFVTQFPKTKASHLDQFLDTELKKQVLRLHDSSRPGSSVFMIAKGAPEPALKALAEAFDRVWKDPQFAEEYKKLSGEPTDPITGPEIHQVLEQMPRDPKIMEIYQQIIGAGPLPPAR